MNRYKNLAHWFDTTDLRSPRSGEIEVDEWFEGKYQVDALLGYGHTAMVFRAIDTKLERYVALKVWIDTGYFDSSILLREGKLIANIQHPNIVKVYEFGLDDYMQRPWMSLEYLGNDNLFRFLRASKSVNEFEKVVDLGIQLASIVDYLHHSANVFQLDIKPGNLALDSESWKIKLMDLGSAFRSGYGNIERLGTPGYIAPEVFDESEFSESSDIFSVGMVLYQSSTGENPLIPIQRKALVEVDAARDDEIDYITAAIPITHPVKNQSDSQFNKLLARMREIQYSVRLREFGFPQKFSELMDTMCSSEPTKRPTALEVRNRLLALQKKKSFPTIFVSHSHIDKARFVHRFSELLEKKNIPIWLDEKDLKVGEPFWERIEDAIETSDYVVVILSKNSISSSGVAEELRTAQLYNLDNVKILPIRIDPLPYEHIPRQLRSRHILDFVGWESPGILEKKTDKFIADVVSLYSRNEHDAG